MRSLELVLLEEVDADNLVGRGVQLVVVVLVVAVLESIDNPDIETAVFVRKVGGMSVAA